MLKNILMIAFIVVGFLLIGAGMLQTNKTQLLQGSCIIGLVGLLEIIQAFLNYKKPNSHYEE